MTAVTQRAARLAAGVWVATMVIVAVGMLLPTVTTAPPGLDGFANWRTVLFAAVTNTSLGALIAARRPSHPIGWLLAAGGLAAALQLATGQYAALGAAVVTGTSVAAWLSLQLQFVTVASIVVVLLLFPTGRPLSPRWWLPVWCVGAAVVLNAIASGLMPGPMDLVPSSPNPFGIAGAEALLDAVGMVAGGLYSVGIAGSVASLALRFRRSVGIERQQVKALFFAATLSIVALVGANVAFPRQMETTALGDVVWGAAAASLSLAITIAMLRYRLFEIDRLISRTLAYAVVTTLLAGVYAGVAVVPTMVFDVRSDLLVAVATLAAAGAFGPLRRRVQAAVDRRFNRTRYDAVRTVDAFGTRQRAQPGLATVVDDVSSVVRATLQPSAVSVWLSRERR